MNACMSEFRIVNPTLRTFSAAEARIAHSSIRFNNLSAAELGYPWPQQCVWKQTVMAREWWK